MDPLRARELVLDTNWMVRHPPGDERLVLHVAWNAAGHALATDHSRPRLLGRHALVRATADNLPKAGSLRVVERLTARNLGRGGSDATLFEYSRDGVRELFRGPDREVTFGALTTGFDDVAVVLGNKPGAPPLLHALVGERLAPSVAVVDASMITDLARVDDERWLIVGRGHDGRAYAAYYRPLDWQLDRLPVPRGSRLVGLRQQPRATGCRRRRGRRSLPRDRSRRSQATHTRGYRPDLSCVAIDTLGRHWAAGPGRVWSRQTSGEWTCVWQHSAWQPPFVSIMAEIGTVIAMTVDGAVLECRSTLLDTYPAI